MIFKGMSPPWRPITPKKGIFGPGIQVASAGTITIDGVEMVKDGKVTVAGYAYGFREGKEGK